jgi:hypothetical protein
MMSVSLSTDQELLGLFELDDAGKVLYYRPDADSNGMSLDMKGHNFYDELAAFENVEEFRRCVTDFTRGTKAADSFDFECRYRHSARPVRVLLARIRDRWNHSTKSILVHIRMAVTTHEKTQKFRGEQ